MARRNSLKDEWKFEPEKVLDGQSISIDSIVLPASQPRRYFDPQKLQQLTESVRQHGILEPLLVRPAPEAGKYELVAGERRYRAAREVGLTSVPVTIRELTDEAALQLALVENLQREDLNPVEEAEGILQLLGIRLKMSASEVPSLLYRMRNQTPADGVVGDGTSVASQDANAREGITSHCVLSNARTHGSADSGIPVAADGILRHDRIRAGVDSVAVVVLSPCSLRRERGAQPLRRHHHCLRR